MSARVELYRELIVRDEHKGKILGRYYDGPSGESGGILVDGVQHSFREVYRHGKWRWRFLGANGRIMADGAQGYVRRIDCLNGAATVLGGVAGDGWVNRCVRWGNGHHLPDIEWRPYLEAIPVVDLTREEKP